MHRDRLDYDVLMRHARNADDVLAQTFARVIVASARGKLAAPGIGMGLDRMRFGALVACYFPGAEVQLFGASCDPASPCADCTPVPSDEFDDLVQLLLDHRSDEAEQTEWLAYAVASGCMGGDHLYQDMGLPNRQALSDLMARHFGTLMAKNSANMKWKKFLYKQLCDRAEVRACSAPSCQVCSDYQACFGPEDDSGLARLSALSLRGPDLANSPLPDWVMDVPDEYRAQVSAPYHHERFDDEPSRAYKILGYDRNGECCYYRHQYALTEVALDDEDNFYEEQAYFEEVKAWRLASGAWLSCTTRAGRAGDCRDHTLRPEYAVVPERPR
jgi:nitrogen fixation protein NifQ